MKYEKAYAERATIVRFRDGDTVECFLRCRHCGRSHYETIRLAKIESWEVKGPDRAKALETARILSELYRGKSGPLLVQSHKRDRYNRIIADIAIEDTTLTLLLVRQGFAWFGVGEPPPATGVSPYGKPSE